MLALYRQGGHPRGSHASVEFRSRCRDNDCLPDAAARVLGPGPGRLASEAPQAAGSAGRRLHRRHRVPDGGHRTGARPGPAGRGREQGRRRRHDRDGRTGPRGTRRLHHRLRLARNLGVQPGALRKARLRLGPRLFPDRVSGRRLQRDDRSPEAPGARAARHGRGGKKTTGRTDFFIGRQRHQPSPVGCPVRTDHRHSTAARALQGGPAGHPGRDVRRSDDGLLQYTHGDRPGQGRPAARAGRHQPGPLPAAARCAHAR